MTNPARTQHRNIGDFTNTDRWSHFVCRPDDVFVSTPPKCGTTWTTTIVTMLCHGKTDVIPADLVQWVDADVVPIEDGNRFTGCANPPTVHQVAHTI